ncbi:MAG: DUF4339 domain-containing protein [Verrucomicrobia bacterium]|nr:DUF4339 domain-containing protein [Verrucomicrobiota bacterium]
MHPFITVIIGLACGATCRHFAIKRGRHPFGWFTCGFVFGLIGLTVLLLLPSRKKVRTPAPPFQLEMCDPANEGKLWFYLSDEGVQNGPMSHQALSQAWRDQKIHKQTLVWHENLTDWTLLHTLIK